MITTEGVELREGTILDVVDRHKYLGILHANGNHEDAQEVRKSAT